MEIDELLAQHAKRMDEIAAPAHAAAKRLEEQMRPTRELLKRLNDSPTRRFAAQMAKQAESMQRFRDSLGIDSEFMKMSRRMAEITKPLESHFESTRRLHESFGFARVALFPRIGWKFGAWHDVGYWQLDLAPEAGEPVSIRLVRDVVQ